MRSVKLYKQGKGASDSTMQLCYEPVSITAGVTGGKCTCPTVLGYLELLLLVVCRLATFYSRSRKSRWCKGETSGHFIKVLKVFADCDKDSIIYLGDPIGPACHTGARWVSWLQGDLHVVDDRKSLHEALFSVSCNPMQCKIHAAVPCASMHPPGSSSAAWSLLDGGNK